MYSVILLGTFSGNRNLDQKNWCTTNWNLRFIAFYKLYIINFEHIIREAMCHKAVRLHSSHGSNSTPKHKVNPWNKRGSN